MGLTKFLKVPCPNFSKILNTNSFENLLRIVDAIPNLAGFSIKKEKVGVIFWILHLSLMFYIYGAGSVVYQIWYAQDALDFIKSHVNVSLLVLILNCSYWWLTKRAQIKLIIKKAREHDGLIQRSVLMRATYEKLLRTIKIILFIFYSMNYFNEFVIYLGHRIKLTYEYGIVPCVGMKAMTRSPNGEICSFMLGYLELSISTVVLNYQGLLIFLIAHTGVTYQVLADEIMTFNTEEIDNVNQKLPDIVNRHVAILDVVKNLKYLYSITIGIQFASNAVCISLFFYLPLKEWLMFVPIMAYCFLTFFLYCFLGQRIVNGAEVLERAVYSCGWERFGVKERKMIYVMMMLAQRPVEILAADIIPVNISTFATTCQAMFKFVTVVKV